MNQARRRPGGWRQTIFVMGLVSLLMMALPAQAGLGGLVDEFLDPVEDIPTVGDIVAPIADDVVAPVVEGTVETGAGDLIDPVVDGALAPVLDDVVAPVTEAISPVGSTTTTIPSVIAPLQEAPVGESAEFGLSSTDYAASVLLADAVGGRGGQVISIQSTTQLQSLEAALALQMTLVGNNLTEPSPLVVDRPSAADVAEANWLNGLTHWLRSSADGLLNLLALPIRLAELLARALLTTGSGLIAPLSMLVAFTALLAKDRGWGGARVI